MKVSLLTLAVAAAICAGVFGTGRALATTSHQTASKTVKIVMHDPGCHWFMLHGKYATKDTVKANRVKLVNQDEAGAEGRLAAGHEAHPRRQVDRRGPRELRDHDGRSGIRRQLPQAHRPLNPPLRLSVERAAVPPSFHAQSIARR